METGQEVVDIGMSQSPSVITRMNPKVSLIMSVYNGGAQLAPSIESILAQTYPSFECVIVNDASADGTADVIASYAARDPRIVVVTNDRNLGLTKSLNKGIRAAKGDYIARMDAGDISEPTRFEKEVSFLDANPEYGLVGTWAYVIDEQSNQVGTMQYPTDHESLASILIRYNPFVHSSVMIRRSVLEQTGLYDEAWRYAQDYELFFRLLKYGKAALIGEYLVSYREYAQSITSTKNKQQVLFAIKARLKAIRGGQYGWWSLVYLWRPILGYIFPFGVKKMVKKLLA